MHGQTTDKANGRVLSGPFPSDVPSPNISMHDVQQEKVGNWSVNGFYPRYAVFLRLSHARVVLKQIVLDLCYAVF